MVFLTLLNAFWVVSKNEDVYGIKATAGRESTGLEKQFDRALLFS